MDKAVYSSEQSLLEPPGASGRKRVTYKPAGCLAAVRYKPGRRWFLFSALYHDLIPREINRFPRPMMGFPLKRMLLRVRSILLYIFTPCMLGKKGANSYEGRITYNEVIQVNIYRRFELCSIIGYSSLLNPMKFLISDFPVDCYSSDSTFQKINTARFHATPERTMKSRQ